ncbi:MAG: hypothetical protein ACHQ51_15355 [Elusimicrobiota bacterium]
MTENEFARRFPALNGALGALADSTGATDVQIAREAVGISFKRKEQGRKMIVALLQECNVFLSFLPDEWDALAAASNRRFDGPNDARDWLISMMTCWETLLRELDR